VVSQGAGGARRPCRIVAALDPGLCPDAAAAACTLRRALAAGADGVTLTARGNSSPRVEQLEWFAGAADGLDVVVAPYDLAVVRRLAALRFWGWKVEAPVLTHLPLLDEVAADGRPVTAAVAGCTPRELEDALARLPAGTTLLHTVRNAGAIGVCDVAHVSALRQYHRPVGYADNGLDPGPALVAVALGAEVVEKPLTLDPAAYAARDRACLLPHEFRSFVDQVRQLEAVLGGHGARDPQPEELDAIDQDRVSIVAARPIPRGTAIERDMLTFQAPGAGLPPRFVPLVEGHRVLYDIPEGALVTLGLIEP
jgi:sialic acid synthase SpsE